MDKLKIEYISIDKIKPYKNNAKIHTQEQIQQIMKSIQDFGMNDPIAVWKDNEIIEGHGRLEALKKLGVKTVPIIRLDDLTDEQRKAYTLVHNKLTMDTGFDFSTLNIEIKSIDSIDMGEFGFQIYDEKDVPNIERRELQPYKKIHYLITLDINDHDKVIDFINQLGKIAGVEIDSTLN